MAKKPTLMRMHEFMQRQVQLLGYLEGGYLCRTTEVPTAQEKSEQIFFAQPKAHQFKVADLNKMVPTDPLKLIACFKHCQATDKAAGILKKIAEDKKQPKEKKTAQLPTACSRALSYWQHCCHKYRDYHQRDWRNCGDPQPDYCHREDQCHHCPWRNNKDLKRNKSYDKKDDCKRSHSKKKSNKAMHNDQSSLLSMGNLSGRRGCSCSWSPLRSRSLSHSCLSSRSYNNHHVAQDNRRSSVLPKHRYLYSSESDDDGRIHRPDKSNTIFATFSEPIAKKGKRTQE